MFGVHALACFCSRPPQSAGRETDTLKSEPQTILCPVCSSPECPVRYSLPFPFARCAQCGLLFRTDRDEIAHPNLAYETEDATSRSAQLRAEETARRPYINSRVERISQKVKPPGNLLEIGTGTGSLLVELQRLGWEIEGIEPSPLLHAHAVNQLGATSIHRCDLSEAQGSLRHRSYRVIVALDVIEHLPDPFLLTRRAFDWLEPGGYLFLQTPNVESLRHRLAGARWEQLAPSEHYILHCIKSLRWVIVESGLEGEELHTLSGGATDNLVRRLCMHYTGACLNLLGLGNALWAVARKRPS